MLGSTQILTIMPMPIYQNETIEIYYPVSYSDIQHLGIEDFSETIEFFHYETSMVVCNKSLSETANRSVFIFNKYWFGGLYIDCYTGEGEPLDVESACEEINAYLDTDIHTFIEKIPLPDKNDVWTDD